MESLFPSMHWIANNLTALEAVLVNPDLIGFNKDPHHLRVRLNPTNVIIGRELYSFRSVPNIDTLLIYYCGHGDVSGGSYFLTGTDARESPFEKLPFERFEDEFLRIKAQRKILILDACYSGRALSDHLGESASILETNVDRLTEKGKNYAGSNDAKQGIYVIASADCNKPAGAKDDQGRLTAFTSLFVRQLKTGLPHRNDSRLSLNDIMDVVKVQAMQQGLPEPVTSDKFGLGSWRIIGNAAVMKRQFAEYSADIRLFLNYAAGDAKYASEFKTVLQRGGFGGLIIESSSLITSATLSSNDFTHAVVILSKEFIDANWGTANLTLLQRRKVDIFAISIDDDVWGYRPEFLKDVPTVLACNTRLAGRRIA
jgi:hypothetical protein